jgi:hypothetical protein
LSTFNIAGGITFAGSSSFPDGTYTISSYGSNTDSSGNHYGIFSTCACTITFGNGSYNIAYGIYLGSATFSIANSSDGTANGTFVVPCSYASGGSCDSAGYAFNTTGSNTITIGPYTNYDFNGNFSMQSGTLTLSPGTYTINGSFGSPSSEPANSITGTGVSIIASGAINIAASSSGTGFSLSAPTALTNLSSPSVQSIVLASNTSAASAFTVAGGASVLLGALYIPNSALSISPTHSLSGGTSGCMMIVASSITINNDGYYVSTDCTTAQNSSSVSLVQ